MEYAVQSAVAQPTLQYDVRGVDGAPMRLVEFSGVVGVGPAQPVPNKIRYTGQAQPGDLVSFYVPDSIALPMEAATIAVQVTPAQVVVNGRTDLHLVYGVGGVSARFVAAEDGSGLGWVLLEPTVYGSDHPIGLAYRVTVTHPV